MISPWPDALLANIPLSYNPAPHNLIFLLLFWGVDIQLSCLTQGGMKMSGFWEGKEPCWTALECSKYVYPKCPAYLYPEIPCWEAAYTQNEILLGIKRDCKNCKVFRLNNNLPGRMSI